MAQRNNSPVDFGKLRKELVDLFESFLKNPKDKEILSKAMKYDKEFSGLTHYKEEFSFGEKIPDDISNALKELTHISFYDTEDTSLKHFSNEEIHERIKKALENLKKNQ